MSTTFVSIAASVLLIGALFAPAARAQRLTTADPNFSELSELSQSIGWYRTSGTKSWAVADQAVNPKTGAVCLKTLDKLRAAGVPDTRTVETSWGGPEFAAGVHTLAEIRTSCEHVDKVGRIGEFEKWAILAMQSGKNASHDAPYFKMCLQTYNRIIKAGVAPTDTVPERTIGGVAWSGSIEELKTKYCDAGMSRATEQTAAQEAPFRKELRDDKLKLALKYGSVFLPGGAGTSDAHRMAMASVWFLDLSPPKHCVNGLQVHSIRRYQFDANQHLERTSEQDYCGSAPSSAFR